MDARIGHYSRSYNGPSILSDFSLTDSEGLLEMSDIVIEVGGRREEQKSSAAALQLYNLRAHGALSGSPVGCECEGVVRAVERCSVRHNAG